MAMALASTFGRGLSCCRPPHPPPDGKNQDGTYPLKRISCRRLMMIVITYDEVPREMNNCGKRDERHRMGYAT